MLHPHADLAAQGVHQALAAGRGADGAIQQRGAQAVKEAGGDRLALHQAHGARVAVRHDGLWVARRNGLQSADDVVQRLVPAHGLESARSLGPHAAQRPQDTIRVVGAFGVARNLGTQHAARRPMGGIPLNLQRHAVLYCSQKCAGVRAVVGARAAHHVLRQGRPGGKFSHV